MKIWILTPIENLNAEDDPWEPWYDKCFGMVIVAEDETTAREIAQSEGLDEKVGRQTPWMEPKYTTCDELTIDKYQGLVMQDVKQG